MGKQGYLCFSLLMVAILVATLGMAGCAAPQPKPGAGASSTTSSPSDSAPGGVPQEGIKVHGHWIIEVTNPDGTLAERREFENALQPDGAGTLVKFLGRKNSVGGWYVRLGSTTSSSLPFMTTSGTPAAGFIVESSASSYGLDGPNYFSNLLVDVPTSGTNANKLVLSGNATAQRDGTINSVSTVVSTLSATSLPSGAYFGLPNFTNTDLPSAVNVSSGQQVAVTVVISFS